MVVLETAAVGARRRGRGRIVEVGMGKDKQELDSHRGLGIVIQGDHQLQ
jgi:hypothetical protein